MDKNEREQDRLSFEALKRRVGGRENEESEHPFADLLSELDEGGVEAEERKASESVRDAEKPEGKKREAPPRKSEESKAEKSSNEGFSLRMEDDIFGEIMAAVEHAEYEAGPTGRRSKYASEEHSYVDVENVYQSRREEEPEPLQGAVARSEKTAKAQEPAETVEAAQGKGGEEEDEKPVRTFNELFRDWSRAFFPNRQDRFWEIVRKVVMDLSVFTLIGCAIWFGVLMGQKNKVRTQLETLKKEIIPENEEQSEDEAWAEFLARYPNVELPEGMKPKYAYLYAINPELVGWIRIPNTQVDVQIVQAADNSKYLKRDFYGNYSRYGCPFMDCRNDPKYLNQNTIVYGHHMSDGLVFAELDKYKKVEGFTEAPIIELDTLFRTYKYKIYAVFVTNSIAAQDNDYIFNYTVTKFHTKKKFDGYIAGVDERKYYTTGVDMEYSDRLLTLSTCSYEFPEARLVVLARMLRDGEGETVNTKLAAVNENQRWPQIWYDKRHRENPFADAEKWYVSGRPPESGPAV